MIHTLDPIRLSADSALARDLPPRARDPAHPGWDRYDRKTLVYGAIHMPERRMVRVYLPRLFNFVPMVRAAMVTIDGAEAHLRRHRIFRRYEILDFRHSGNGPRELELTCKPLGGVRIEVHAGDDAPFADRRAVYTILKNERLEWIRDWLHFHAAEHGADAVLISDNGSTDYDSETLLDVIRGVPGYAVAQVLSVPLPWGPAHRAPGVDDGKLLQTSMLNYCRDRFLRRAQAVLNVDVDELVMRHRGGSVFDAVSPWGYATFPGQWRYAPNPGPGLRHRDHVLYDPVEAPCPTKYVYKPASWLGRRSLSVHSLEHVNRKLFSVGSRFCFLHCRGISTSWKANRLDWETARLLESTGTVSVLHRAFSSCPRLPSDGSTRS